MRFLFISKIIMKLITSSYQNGNGALSLINVDLEKKASEILSKLDLNEPSFVSVNNHLIFTYTKYPLKLNVLTIVANKFVLIDEIDVPLETLTHLAYDDKKHILFGASYKDGAILKVEFKNALFTGLKVVKTGGKCHCVTKLKDSILITNIEYDKLIKYDYDLKEIGSIILDTNMGPRHTIIDGNSLYTVTEYSNELLKINDGKIISKVKTITPNTQSNCATLFKDDYIYVSNRGEETISIFDGNLKFIKAYPTYGLHSRHMVLSKNKKYIISFNKNSNDVTFIDKENGTLKYKLDMDKVSSGDEYMY